LFKNANSTYIEVANSEVSLHIPPALIQRYSVR
jgi:hypothetical protein